MPVGAAVDQWTHPHEPPRVRGPLEYYANNLGSLSSLLAAARAAGVRRIVYSSSGSVDGEATRLPITEDEPHRPTNPYSVTKSVGERMLQDSCSRSGLGGDGTPLFNPAGAHPSGMIGEDPTGLLSNIVPVLMHVAVGDLPSVTVHGDDFDRPDGSGVRGYVHVP